MLYPPSSIKKIIQAHLCEDIAEIISNSLECDVINICIDTCYVFHKYESNIKRNIEHLIISPDIKKKELLEFLHLFFDKSDICLSSYNIKTNIREKALWKILTYFLEIYIIMNHIEFNILKRHHTPVFIIGVCTFWIMCFGAGFTTCIISHTFPI